MLNYKEQRQAIYWSFKAFDISYIGLIIKVRTVLIAI